MLSFGRVQEISLKSAEELRQFTELEVKTYESKNHAVYLANEALVTVFTDVTERSPTFSLAPLSTVDEYRNVDRKCWIEILTPADS